MAVYVVLKKRSERGTFLPNFESFTELPVVEPKHMLLTLEPGDCVDVAKFNLSEDLSYVEAKEFRVSNIDNQLVEELTGYFTLARHVK